MSRALATGLLLLLGCGGAYAPTEAREEHEDEAPADAADAMVSPEAMPMCHMKCTDISAPCGCHDGSCEFRQYDGAVIDVCLQMP